jgi:predicted transposase YdaD
MYLLLLILHRRPAEEHNELLTLVERHTEDMEVSPMAQSMAEMLLERGKAQGIEQGETQAKQAVILKMIRLRFDSVPEAVTNQITQIRSHSRLDVLVEDVMTAQTLDEIDWQNCDG